MKPEAAAFQAQIIELAKLCHWAAYHTFDSRHSSEGFPDLVLVSPFFRLIVFAELKQDRKAKVSPAQIAWLEVLRMALKDLEMRVLVRCWTPADWPEIKAVLTGAQQ